MLSLPFQVVELPTAFRVEGKDHGFVLHTAALQEAQFGIGRSKALGAHIHPPAIGGSLRFVSGGRSRRLTGCETFFKWIGFLHAIPFVDKTFT